MHRAWVHFVTDGDPGWERYATGIIPVMAFTEKPTVFEKSAPAGTGGLGLTGFDSGS